MDTSLFYQILRTELEQMLKKKLVQYSLWGAQRSINIKSFCKKFPLESSLGLSLNLHISAETIVQSNLQLQTEVENFYFNGLFKTHY